METMMSSLFKNQILKHLSKFTKNLSEDQLQLSTFKGFCDVTNIELNESVLMDLLELPVWMSLTRAFCNYAMIKIQWMKLKTVPISIVLDEVIIDIETCEDFREENSSRNKSFVNSQETNKYGFIQKVIDGITLSINSVQIQFSSKIFSASVELTRIIVESRNCNWKKVDDLSKTRIRDQSRGQVLIFKHIEWQTFRFVAKSETKTSIGQAPLKLIADQSSCRITLKKRLSDCAVLTARIMLIFEHLLWVLNDSQLLSTLHFVKYLGDLIKKTPRRKKFEDSDFKNHQQLKNKTIILNNNDSSQKVSSLKNSMSLLFGQQDIKETSHHIIIRQVEVHLMDDGPQCIRSQCPDLKDGGALKLSFQKLILDVYPYHQVNGGSGDRTHWFHYNDPSPHRNSFIVHKLNSFYKKQQTKLKQEGSNFDITSLNAHLLSQVIVIRLSDFSIGCVSTNHFSRNNQNSEDEWLKLVSIDHDLAVVPTNVPPVYVELNNYFYLDPFDKLDLQIPESNIFLSMASLKVCFEPTTILWINAFFANLHNALIKLQEVFPVADNRQNEPNIRAEILMPLIVVKLNNKIDENVLNFEYDSIEIRISKIVAYNCDSFINKDYFRNLESLIQKFSANSSFFHEYSQYPWFGSDMKPISNEFMAKIDKIFHNDSVHPAEINIDFLTIHVEPVWIDFKSTKSHSSDPFLDPLNLTIWLNKKSEHSIEDLNLNIFLKVADPVKLKLTHDQFIFLLRIIEMFGKFSSMLNNDTYLIQRGYCEKDIEIKYSGAKLNSFELENKILNTIFKNTSVVTSISDVNLFLILHQKCEVLEENIFSNYSENNLDNKDHAKINFVGIDSSEKHVNDLNSVNIENNQKKDFLLDSNHLKLNINESSKNFESFDGTENYTKSSESSSPNLDFNGKVISDLLGGNKNKSYNESDVLNNESIKQNFLSPTNFNSSNIKIHYAIENEDTLSTISDFDESDRQSMLAMINENTDSILDDILEIRRNPPVEEAVDVLDFDNFKFSNNNEDADTINDSILDNNIHHIREPKQKISLFDVLHVRLNDVDLVQQSSKGFLSQIFLDLSLNNVAELQNLNEEEYLIMFKNILKSEKNEEEKSENKIQIRIDSYNKGTSKDELVSVNVESVLQSLKKETLDLLIDFFQDNITEYVAPLSVSLKKICFTVIDQGVRVPPTTFNVPKLLLNRDEQNQWIIEFNSSLNDSQQTNHLLMQHLKIFERNFLLNSNNMVREQDKLSCPNKVFENSSEQNEECQEILKQVLNQKELLFQENELLRKENSDLRNIIKSLKK